MDWIIENGNAIFEIALKVVGAFSVIASLTPNTTDNKVADALMRIINGESHGPSPYSRCPH